MSGPLIVSQLRVCADMATQSPNEHTYLNSAAREILKQAADEIAKLRAALEEILPIADGSARPLQGLAIATIARKALAEQED